MTGEQGRGDQQGTAVGAVDCLAGGPKHGSATEGVDAQHPHAQLCGLGAGTRDGGRNIVVLEIKKDVEPLFHKARDKPRPGGREQFQSHLETALRGVHLRDE